MGSPPSIVFRLLRTTLTPEEAEEARTGGVSALEVVRDVPLNEWEVADEWEEAR